MHKVQIHFGKDCVYFFAFVFAHEAVIHVNAYELVGHGFGDERGAHGGVHAARKAEQDFFIAHLFANGFYLLFDVIVHIVKPFCAADVIDKIFDDLFPFRRVLHFGVELYAVEFLFGIFECRNGAVFGMRGGLKAFGQPTHIIGVTHQRNFFLVEIAEERAGVFEIGFDLSVFAYGAGRDLTAERIRHKLHAVAYAENGNAEFENALIAFGGSGVVNAVRPARENDADGVDFLDFFNRRSAGKDLRMHVHFPYAARNEFFVLTAEVEHDDGFVMVHKCSP